MGNAKELNDFIGAMHEAGEMLTQLQAHLESYMGYDPDEIN